MEDNKKNETKPTGEVPENANQGCVGIDSDKAGKASSCAGCPNQQACSSGQAKAQNTATLNEVSNRMSDIKHKILILSGKGGVGKSTFAAQLAWSLSLSNFQVGIMDIDICGPSVPRMMGVEKDEVKQSNFGWSPVYADSNLGVMSVGFMLQNKNDAIIWRGPKKDGLIKQFLTDVFWGELDFLIIDAPPGTSDEHISIAQYLKQSNVDGAVIVTTPQEISLLDVRKEITFCKKVNIPIIGVVENMSGFICPCCKTKSDIFPAVSGGAEKMSKDMNVPFLGSIPLDPNLLLACESGKSVEVMFPHSSVVKPFKAVIQKLMNSSTGLAETFSSSKEKIDHLSNRVTNNDNNTSSTTSQ